MPRTYKPAWRMNSEHKGKNFAQKGKPPMTADYGQRAANALDLLIPGPHRDKEVARKFGVSVRMEKYLRAGKHWTAERFAQASTVLGDTFDLAIASPEQHNKEMADIAGRLARLEAQFAEVVRREDARLAPTQGREADQSGRESGEGSPPAGKGGPRA